MENLDLLKDYVLITKYEYQQYILNKYKDNQIDRFEILDYFYRNDRFEIDTEEEQLNLEDVYSGFSDEAQKLLYRMGFSKNELLQFIRNKWDKFRLQKEIEKID